MPKPPLNNRAQVRRTIGTTEVSILVFFAVVIVALIVISVLFGGEGEGELAFHPMDQFMIKPLFGEYGDPVYWYTVTNLTFWMALAVLCVVAVPSCRAGRNRWPS